MVKIKTISRAPEDYTRKRKRDVDKSFRNPNPTLHPFEKAREYKRTLNAVKLDKLFAKPFLFALDGHKDGIWSLETLQRSLRVVASGSCDGEMRVWNLAERKCVWTAKAHRGFVRGITSDGESERLFTCGDDSTIKIWRSGASETVEAASSSSGPAQEAPLGKPIATFLGKHSFVAITHHIKKPQFATAGSIVELWVSPMFFLSSTSLPPLSPLARFLPHPRLSTWT